MALSASSGAALSKTSSPGTAAALELVTTDSRSETARRTSARTYQADVRKARSLLDGIDAGQKLSQFHGLGKFSNHRLGRRLERFLVDGVELHPELALHLRFRRDACFGFGAALD